MNISQTRMPDVVIANGGTDSDAIDFGTDYFDAEAITIQAPAVLAETLTFTGSVDGVTFATIADSTATAVKGPTAGQMITYNGVFTGLKSLKLHLGGAAAVAHTFMIIKSWRGL